MDAFIVILLILIVIFWQRRFDKSVYVVGIIDLFLRLIYWIATNIGIPGFKVLVSKYLPTSIPSIIYAYTDGILSIVLMWLYVGVMVVFLFYSVRTFFRKK